MAGANTHTSPSTAGGNKEYYTGTLTVLEPDKFPVVSMIKKGPAPASTTITRTADTPPRVKMSGTREGKDTGALDNKAKGRAKLINQVHRYLDGWEVTTEQQRISELGGVHAVADEVDYAKMKAVRGAKRSMESVCCGNGEMSGGSGEDLMQTRGFFKWMSATAQSVNPVPADFRPPTTHLLSGVSSPASFTDADLYGVLQAMADNFAGGEYDLVAGSNVIKVVDNLVDTEGTTTASSYTVTENAKDYVISRMVKTFKTSLGIVNMLHSTHVNFTESTQLGDTNAGMIFDRDYWELSMFIDLETGEHPYTPAGHSGWVLVEFSFDALLPRANGAIYNTLS